jgi:hypothetical protein
MIPAEGTASKSEVIQSQEQPVFRTLLVVTIQLALAQAVPFALSFAAHRCLPGFDRRPRRGRSPE